MNTRTLITAHSGADDTPENSLEFVRHVLQTAADALEVDVRRAPDGSLVLGHDAATAVPLSEAFTLTAAHPSMKVNCDLKEADLEADCAALAEQYGLAGRLIFSGEADPARCAPLRPTAELYVNIENHVPDLYRSYREIPDFELHAADRILFVCGRYGVSTVNMKESLVTARFSDTLSAKGVGVSAWTVDNMDDLRWFLSRGVTNVTTRKLSEALSLRAGL